MLDGFLPWIFMTIWISYLKVKLFLLSIFFYCQLSLMHYIAIFVHCLHMDFCLSVKWIRKGMLYVLTISKTMHCSYKKLIKQDFKQSRLTSSFWKFYCRYNDLGMSSLEDSIKIYKDLKSSVIWVVHFLSFVTLRKYMMWKSIHLSHWLKCCSAQGR